MTGKEIEDIIDTLFENIIWLALIFGPMLLAFFAD